jgi:hypothetical protein
MLHEMIDQASRFFIVGRPQIEDELAVRRLALRLGPGEWKEKERRLILMALQDRQTARDRRRTDIVEQQEDLVLLDEAYRVFDRRQGVVAIVIRLDEDLMAMHAPLAVDVAEVGH